MTKNVNSKSAAEASHPSSRQLAFTPRIKFLLYESTFCRVGHLGGIYLCRVRTRVAEHKSETFSPQLIMEYNEANG